VTTAGGVLLPDQPAAEDAPLVRHLRSAGGVVVGKTNLHEFAFGITSENPHYGAVLNPHDRTRVAGGSSGGSAAAVAAGLCDWAVGTDTGGSIRVPASFCGVVGIKPTYGTVSTDGVFPLSRSLDTAGPLAGDLASAWTALAQMTGREQEPAVLDGAPRLGVPAGWVYGLDAPTSTAWARVAEGVPEVPFVDRARAAAAALTVLLYEAAEVHRSWLETRPDAYGADVRALLEQAIEVNRRDYQAALAQMDRLAAEADGLLSDLDALLVPATARVAPELGSALSVREEVTRFTRPFNATRQPVVCLPAPAAGLPVGVQIVGPRGADARVVAVALELERRWRDAA
jgi:aspartyl-tRNA(Asn)/glutamyl-tRNA(Gln) amidotransferase subunit A